MILGNIRNMPLLTTEEYIVEIISIMIYSTRRSKSRIQSKSIIFKLPLTSMLNGEDTQSYIVGFRLRCDYLAVFIHNEVWRSQTFDIYIYELKQRQVSILGQRETICMQRFCQNLFYFLQSAVKQIAIQSTQIIKPVRVFRVRPRVFTNLPILIYQSQKRLFLQQHQ